MDKFSFFILNLVINSFFSFFTAYLLIEFLLWIFRIRTGRLTSYFRMIPFFKLCVDPFLYNFKSWVVLNGVNPLLQPAGTRTLSVSFGTEGIFSGSMIRLSTQGNLGFTIADILGFYLSETILNSISIIFLTIPILFIIPKIIHCTIACVSQKNLDNSLNSTYVGSPYVTGLFKPTLFLSKAHYKLFDLKEIEAIIAHEREHIRYKDNLLKFILFNISSFFWWIPSKKLLKKIELDLEIGCDASSVSKGIDPEKLASALFKSVKQNFGIDFKCIAYFACHPVIERIDFLLKPQKTGFKALRIILAALAASVALSQIFLGRFWIF